MLQYIVIIGAVVQLIGCVSYIKEIFVGKAKPNRITWLLWSVAPIIGSIAAIVDGVRWAVLPTFMAGFGPLLVLIASYMKKGGYWKLGKFDYICGASSVLALILWAITKEPFVAIMFSILSDGLAAVPTLVKATKEPETEHLGPFLGGLFSSSLSFFAVKMWNASELAFPIYLVLINVILILTIYIGQRKNRIVKS